LYGFPIPISPKHRLQERPAGGNFAAE